MTKSFDQMVEICIEHDMAALVGGMPLAKRVRQTANITALWAEEQTKNSLMPSESYCLYLREHRLKSGLTLVALGEHIGVHYTSIQKWETGISSPTIEHLCKLAKFYKIHPASFFFEPVYVK